jgi:hypothetical protein
VTDVEVMAARVARIMATFSEWNVQRQALAVLMRDDPERYAAWVRSLAV